MQINDLDKLTKSSLIAAYKAGIEIMQIYRQKKFKVELKSDNSPLTLADKNAHKIIINYLKNTNIPIISEEGFIEDYYQRKLWDYCWLVDPLDGTREFVKRNGEFTVNVALIENGHPILGVIYAPVKDCIYYAVNKQAFKVNNLPDYQENESFFDFIDINRKSLPGTEKRGHTVVLASVSHRNRETDTYIKKLKFKGQNIKVESVGSSLKFCMIAEGKADIYPRFSKIMEWDTAAGQALVEAVGGSVLNAETGKRLVYNKQNLVNPWFIAKR